MSADDTSREVLIESMCVTMHDAYEAAAVREGWQTQERSRKPWADVPDANKATMRAAVGALHDAVVTPLAEERDRLKAHIERNGIQWCMCSRADRMNERRIPRCPYHGDGMSVQRNVAEQERDEARAEHGAALAEMQRLRDNPIARHIKAERDAAIKRAEEAERRLAVAQERRDHWRRRFTDTAARATGLALNTHAATKALDEYLAASDDDPHSTHDERCHERHERCLAHRVRNTLNPGDNPGKE